MYAKTLAGRYRLDSVHRETDLSIVYRGWDESSRIPVAVKELKLTKFPEDEAKQILQIFIREIKYLKGLNSPVFPKYYDLLTQGNKCYLIMEWIDGKDLRLIMQERVKTPQEIALWYFEVIAKTLMKLQDMETVVLHRGLKPSDILVDESGTVRILDFCTARITNAMNEIRIGSMKTSSYTAPEDLDDDIDADLSSDVYSLGAIIFHMVTGKDPGQFGGIIPSPKSLNSEIPDKFNDLLVDCLKDRKSRVSDMKTLIQRIADSAPKVVEKKVKKSYNPMESTILGTIYFFISLILMGGAAYLYEKDISRTAALVIATLTVPFTAVYILYKMERILKSLFTRQKHEMNPITLYGLSGVATIIGIVAVVFLFLSTSSVQEAKDIALLTGCTNNLKTISIALEAYSNDNKDKGYPVSLKELYPKYLKKVPLCPAVHHDTYSSTYRKIEGNKYSICCHGGNHRKVIGVEGDWPKHTQDGLVKRPGDEDIFEKASRHPALKNSMTPVKEQP